MAQQYSSSKNIRQRNRLLLLAPFLMLLIGAVTYVAVKEAQERIVEFQAINVAEIVARHAASGRSVYATQVAGKLQRDGSGGPNMHYDREKGLVPLPAQFLKMVGREASATSQNLYQYQPISKWNLEPTQGLSDEFKKWAWRQLEAQDQANPAGAISWQPVWRFEKVNGESTLRYLRADPASAQGCVDCHNALEKTGDMIDRRRAVGVAPEKTWKLHQLLGAIEVNIPLNKVEAVVAAQTRQTLAWILSSLGGGLVFVSWFAFSDLSRTRQMLTLSWLATHDSLTGVLNQRGLLQTLTRALAVRPERRPSAALCYVRLEGVSTLGEQHGNKAGDLLLKQVVEAMRRRVADTGVIGRVHGAEFAVYVSGQTPEQAQQLAQALLYAIKIMRFRWAGNVFSVGVNVGMVPVTPALTSAEEALKAAHVACLAAVNQGVNKLYVGRA
jgi:diguanylate cyclase (GGDEF)-like protein